VFDREQYKLHAFVGDKYYCYFGITNLVWNELVEAESKGLYFNTRIKNRYQFKEITAL
jgi:predicted outer membrane lipoprotein